MYYNTVKETGKELKESRIKAVSQDEEVLTIFIENKDMCLTAWDVVELLDTVAPVTSIRRSINTLYKESKLLKSNKTREGVYGKQCICWKLNNSFLVD